MIRLLDGGNQVGIIRLPRALRVADDVTPLVQGKTAFEQTFQLSLTEVARIEHSNLGVAGENAGDTNDKGKDVSCPANCRRKV